MKAVNKISKYSHSPQKLAPSTSLSIRRNESLQYNRPFSRQLSKISQTSQSIYLDHLKQQLSQFINKKKLAINQMNSSCCQFDNINKSKKLSHSKWIKDNNPQQKRSSQKDNPFLSYKARQSKIRTKKMIKDKSIKPYGIQSLKESKNKSFTIKQIKPQPKMKIIKDNIVCNNVCIDYEGYCEFVSIKKSMQYNNKYLQLQKRNKQFTHMMNASKVKKGSLQQNNLNKKHTNNIINYSDLQPWQKQEQNDDIFSKFH